MSATPYIEKVLGWYIDLLKTHYDRSRDLYERMESKKLISIDEYGRYREDACREFIQFVVPGRFAIGEGYIVNATDGDGSISTQTDIVVYDKSTPLFKDSHIRFYPVESIAAIGEVKSTLKPGDLVDALCKLANQKAMRPLANIPGDSFSLFRDRHLTENQNYFLRKIQETLHRKDKRHQKLSEVDIKTNFENINKSLEDQRKSRLSDNESDYVRLVLEGGFEGIEDLKKALNSVVNNITNMREYYYNPERFHFDHVMSFLICKKIDISKEGENYTFANLIEDINNEYNKKGILPYNRHNLILSIDDGIFLYYDGENTKEHIAYPTALGKRMKHRFIPIQEKDEDYHFKQFAHHLFTGVQNTTILHPETSHYFKWNIEQTDDLCEVDEQ